jgi:hypothetical protein
VELEGAAAGREVLVERELEVRVLRGADGVADDLELGGVGPEVGAEQPAERGLLGRGLRGHLAEERQEGRLELLGSVRGILGHASFLRAGSVRP